MGIRTLGDHDGTAKVSLDKTDLQLDGIIDEDGTIPEGQRVHYQRVAPGAYLIRAVRDGEVAELHDVLPR